MATDQPKPAETPRSPFPTSTPEPRDSGAKPADADSDKDAEELSEEELRLMADTMPGDGPGDD